MLTGGFGSCEKAIKDHLKAFRAASSEMQSLSSPTIMMPPAVGNRMPLSNSLNNSMSFAARTLKLIVFSRKSWIYPSIQASGCQSPIPQKRVKIYTPDPGLPGRTIVLSVQTVEAARTIPTTKTKGPSAVTIVGEIGLCHDPYRNGRKKSMNFPGVFYEFPWRGKKHLLVGVISPQL